ncbi:MAG TPA: MobF family relaxase [Candidatus Nanopelagicales bacterium]
MLSIGLIGHGAGAADYYVARQAGCPLDYYTGVGERRGSWTGSASAALALSGELDPEGESVLRGLLAGVGPDGDRLVAGLFRSDPRARVPAAPLVAGVRAAAASAGLSPDMFLDAGPAREFAVVARSLTRSPTSGAGVRADVAVRVAAAAGLDAHAIYAAAAPQAPDLLVDALGRVGERVDARRAGVDLTFSAPKSVSLLFAFGDSTQITAVRDAHETAISEALAYLDRVAGHGLRGHHGDGQSARHIATDGLLGVAFEHRTSRAMDPQLHTHVVVPNLVRGVDGQWSAIDTRALHRHARTAGYLYQAVLRSELTATLGVAWGSVRRGQADLVGVPRDTLAVFSTRRAQIETELAQSGGAGGRAAQVACLTTRPTKAAARGGGGADPAVAATSPAGLRAAWVAKARAAGIDPDQLIRDVTHASTAARSAGSLSREALAEVGVPPRLLADLLGPSGLTGHATSFDRGDVLRALCERLPTTTSLNHQGLQAMVDEVLADPRAVPLRAHGPEWESDDPAQDAEAGRWTTRDLLATEAHALEQASLLRAARDPGTDAAVIAAVLEEEQLLNAEQSAMVAHLTADGGRLRMVVGPAGSGKTAALALAHRIWRAQGRYVRGVTLSAIAARGLNQATFIFSTTLASVLHELEPGPVWTRANFAGGAILVVDEAAMVGTRDLARLLAHAVEHNMTMVLVGDPAQLPEIGAGGLFTHLLTQTPTTVLTENHRQVAPWEQRALTRLRDGDVPGALDEYLRHDRITVSPDHQQLQNTIAQDYIAHLDHATHPDTADPGTTIQPGIASALLGHDPTRAPTAGGVLVVAATRRHAAGINDKIRELLSERGDLHGPELTCRGGEEPLPLRAGDRVLVTLNDHDRGLLNGEHVTITAVDVEQRQAVLVTSDHRQLDVTSDWAGEHLTHGYAMTAHKAQGQTVGVTLVAGSAALTRETSYTALSRGRATNHLYLAPDAALDPADEVAQAWITDHALTDTSRHLRVSRRQTLARLQHDHGYDLATSAGPTYDPPAIDY